MMWYKDRHSLLLECSITFLICIRMVEEVQTLYKKLIANNMSYMQTPNLKFGANYQISGTLSAEAARDAPLQVKTYIAD